MSFGISQLENRNWVFKNNVQVKGEVRRSTDRYCLVENFEKLPQLNGSVAYSVNNNFEVLGTNASNDDVTVASTIAGIQLQTDGASADQVIVLPHLTAGLTTWTGIVWGTENQTSWECVIRTGALTNCLIWAGLKLTNTSVIATDNDQVMFRYSAAADTYWNCIYSIGGTDVAVVSSVAVAATTTYNLRIEIDSSRIAAFYINDVCVARSTALTNDVNLIPYVGIQAEDATVCTLNLCREQISRIWFE